MLFTLLLKVWLENHYQFTEPENVLLSMANIIYSAGERVILAL